MEKKIKSLNPWSLMWLIMVLLGIAVSNLNLWGAMDQINADLLYSSPSLDHWFGTDSMGRDLFRRVFQGSGVSVLIALIALLIMILLSILYGGVAGWFGGWIDLSLSIFLDIWLSIPPAVLAALVALLFVHTGNSSPFLMGLVIGFTHWGRLTRLVRGEVARLRKEGFIRAGQALGLTFRQTLFYHLVPHVSRKLALVLVYQIPNLILAESFLSFIGIGVQSPQTSLGLLLQDGWRSLQVFPHVVVCPALILFLTIFSLNNLSLHRVHYVDKTL